MNEYERMLKIMEIEQSMGIDEKSRYMAMMMCRQLTQVQTEPIKVVEVPVVVDVIEIQGVETE